LPDTIPVTFDPKIAAALEDSATHARVERLIGRTARSATVENL